MLTDRPAFADRRQQLVSNSPTDRRRRSIYGRMAFPELIEKAPMRICRASSGALPPNGQRWRARPARCWTSAAPGGSIIETAVVCRGGRSVPGHSTRRPRSSARDRAFPSFWIRGARTGSGRPESTAFRPAPSTTLAVALVRRKCRFHPDCRSARSPGEIPVGPVVPAIDQP